MLPIPFRLHHLPAEFRQVPFHRIVEAVFPSSTSISTAAVVIVFDCEAIQKSESAAMGRCPAMSAHPTVSVARMPCRSATKATARPAHAGPHTAAAPLTAKAPPFPHSTGQAATPPPAPTEKIDESSSPHLSGTPRG